MVSLKDMKYTEHLTDY